MQKVITITGNTAIQAGTFSEVQHPELNKLLSEGYIIKDTITTLSQGTSGGYSLTFILDIPKETTAPLSNVEKLIA